MPDSHRTLICIGGPLDGRKHRIGKRATFVRALRPLPPLGDTEPTGNVIHFETDLYEVKPFSKGREVVDFLVLAGMDPDLAFARVVELWAAA